MKRIQITCLLHAKKPAIFVVIFADIIIKLSILSNDIFDTLGKANISVFIYCKSATTTVLSADTTAIRAKSWNATTHTTTMTTEKKHTGMKTTTMSPAMTTTRSTV